MPSLRVARRRIAPSVALAAVFSAPWSVAAEAEFDRKPRQQRSALVAVVGPWLQVDDGGPAFKFDGARWSGQTQKSDLEAAGRLLFASAAAAFVANGSAPEAFPLAVWRDVLDVSSGTIRVQFKLVGGPTDQTAGVVIGLQPSGEYFFVRYNTKDGNVAIWGYANGQRRALAHGTVHAQLPLNTWHELTVTIAGAKVTGSVTGDSLKVEHTLDAPVSGRIGVWTKRDAVTAFKNVRVSR